MEHVPAPRGLIVDLVTPLKENGEIDGRGLGRHLDRILGHVHAIFLASPYAGEGINLSAPQREDLLDKALVVVRGRMPLFVWVTGEREEETKHNLLLLQKRVEARKYAGPVLWVDTPLHYHSNRGLPLLYRNLCTGSKRPWVLHNDPELIRSLGRSFKRTNIRTAVFKLLSRVEDIRGLIFLGPLEREGNYRRAVRKRSDFRIYDGDESRFLKHPSMSGVLSAGANLAPKAWRKIVDASLNMADGREDYPDRLQQLWEAGARLQNLLEIYRPFPAPVLKGALAGMGILESLRSTVRAEGGEEKAKALIEEVRNSGEWEV